MHKLTNLMNICIDLNRKDFAVFFNFAAHINVISVSVHPDGYKEDGEIHQIAWINLNKEHVSDQCDAAISTLEKLSYDSEQRHSPENKAKLDAEKVSQLIEKRNQLDEQIKALGGDSLVCNGGDL